MIKKCAIVLLAIGLAAGCTIVSTPRANLESQQTQLEIREYQTRQFDTNNVVLIMKAVINVLQDDGFRLNNTDKELGIISATKEINLNSKESSPGFWGELLGALADDNKSRHSHEKTYNKIRTVEASINISEYGRYCKVRASFYAKTIDNKGNPVDVGVVSDKEYYQTFFSKVDKGVFLQRQGL